MRLKLEGVRELTSALKKIQRSYGKAFEKASGWAAEQLLVRIEPTVPIETGALRASAGWQQEGKGWNTVTWVGYGYPVSGFYRGDEEKHPEDYAVMQHDWYETKRTPGTRWQYLLLGIQDNEDFISQVFFDYMRFTVK